MQNLSFLCLLFLLLGIPAFGNGYETANTDVQMRVDAFLQDVLNYKKLPCIDVKLVKEVVSPPENEDKVREIVTEIYGKSNIASVHGKKLNPLDYQAEIESEVRHILCLQNPPRIINQRIRADGRYLRLDQTILSDNFDGADCNGYAATYINSGFPNEGDYTHYLFDHVEKTATIWNCLPMWSIKQVNEFGTIPAILQKKIRMHAFNRDVKRSDRCEIRIDQNVTLVDGVPVIKARILLEKEGEQWELVCHSENANIVYDCSCADSRTHNKKWERECRDFDSSSFPHSIVERQWDDEGVVLKEERIAVVNVKFSRISDQIFKFKLPVGYTMIDRRVAPPMIIDEFIERGLDLDFDPMVGLDGEGMLNEHLDY